ncbi:cadherin-like and PC-esterase domain-containing protein 1 [Periophthalmus magnuspinnatus]|uniref:cadherin-like and PC-esterase domain-containing protein 1 n=1 Tax=Periophthalmus magnuspinnatus TaxID=409849 RepID=UPI0024364FC5|nr:cadherin-like and PC-esterase domain-containing protein 1 [Periophthalmus magnuspinnatus]XP_055087783.1 cadherin-like and PC-esterase domain-containing protein 1 [Periophthalmus magnuspinnatus]
MRCLLALVCGLLWRDCGMLLRRRLYPGPLLLLLGVALCLFYQTLNVALNRLQVHQQPSPRVHGSRLSDEVDLEESQRFISALEAVRAQVQQVSDRGAQLQRVLVLTGRHVITDTEVQLYMRVLQQMGYDVQLSRYAETSSLLRPKQGMTGVSLLLCLSSSETSCLRRVPFSQLQSHQRVNLLPQMIKAFSDAGGGLCHMFTHRALTGSKIPMRLYSCAFSQDQGSTGATSLTKPIASPQAVVNIYILVTSFDPLIVFMHDIIVLSANGERGQPNRLKNLRPEVLSYPASYQDMIGHMKRIIGDVLQAAASTYEKDQTIKRCLLCYQLLTFTLLFNTSLTPIIIQVDTDWTFSALNDKTFDQKITKDLMLEDMLHFLLKSPTLLSSVTNAVKKEGDSYTRTLGVGLSEDHQLLLLQFYQQMKLPGPFQLLYPNTTLCPSSVHPHTVDDFFVKTACYYNRSLRTVKELSLASTGHSHHFLSKENAMCVDPQLRQLYTDPPLSMTPPFDPRVKEYRVEVPFDTVMVRIRPEPLSLNCRVHLDEHHGPSMANLPIGLGQSRISILVTDGGESEVVMAIYTLHVFRESRPSLPMFGDHVMCSFTQECSLLVQPDRPCGLEPFNKSQSPPQPCSSGDKPGRWVVPCLSCLDNRTCDWREIVWQPDNCYYPLINRLQLQNCMADRKLLFIGDSTNRGMMYFLMERVNTSLENWEKAHDTLIYSNLNGGQTLISYSYYPQFWLEANQRPTFTDSLEKLLDRSRPLLNSRQTVLVVGGVQWLNSNHLRAIREALNRKGLSNILVVVKSLGMGFHLLVDGVRSLKLREIQDLSIENQNLISTAKKYGFEVIDTFSITMGRYKEFLQGRCACHFHEVEKCVPSKTSFDSKTNASGTRSARAGPNTAVTWGHGSKSLSYKVKGPVNQVYSEILLSRLCPDTNT